MTSTRLSRQLCAELRRKLDAGGMPRIPAGGELLWRWFIDLNAARTWGAAGPNPIAFTEIEAFARLSRWPLEELHVAILKAMDREMLAHFRRRADAANSGVKSLPPISKTPMTVGMIDAMFS